MKYKRGVFSLSANLMTLEELKAIREINNQTYDPEKVRKSTVCIKAKLDMIVNQYLLDLKREGTEIKKSELYRILVMNHLEQHGYLPNDFDY